MSHGGKSSHCLKSSVLWVLRKQKQKKHTPTSSADVGQLLFNTVSKVCSQVQHQFRNYYYKIITDFSPICRTCLSVLFVKSEFTSILMGLVPRGVKGSKVGGPTPPLHFLWFTWAQNDGWIRLLHLCLPVYVVKGFCSNRFASIQHYQLDKEDLIDIFYTKYVINKNTPEFS